jgi:hypothetical protein
MNLGRMRRLPVGSFAVMVVSSTISFCTERPKRIVADSDIGAIQGSGK